MATVTFDHATRIYPGNDRPSVDALDLEIADGEFGKRDLPATFPDAHAPVDGQLRAAGLWLKLVPLPNRTIVRSSSGSSPSSIERRWSREWENCCMRNTSLRASRSSTTGSPL